MHRLNSNNRSLLSKTGVGAIQNRLTNSGHNVILFNIFELGVLPIVERS